MKKVLACGRPVPAKQKNKLDEPFKDFLREKLQAHIRARELNQSESRNQILEVLLGENSHFSTAELLKKVESRFPHIGTATVYRNLAVFLEAGILRETLTDEQGLKVFELENEDHHDHIVCLDCGHIFEFHDQGIERAQEKLSEQLDFRPVHHNHVIYAHCSHAKK